MAEENEARPGSSTSLLRSIVGMYIRDVGGWIAVTHLVDLMQALDVPPARTRTTLTRLKGKHLLVARTVAGRQGCSITPLGLRLLQRSDRRLFSSRSMRVDEQWCLVSFTVPEERRDLRHRLRQRLANMGCGSVAPGLWICPWFLSEEVREIFSDLGLEENCVLFPADAPVVSTTLADALAQWWDLDRLAELHRRFDASVRERLADNASGVDSRRAFGIYVRTVDAWRVIRRLDPGLPPELLPPQWPGRRTLALLGSIRTDYESLAAGYVAEVTRSGRRLSAEQTGADSLSPAG